MTTDSDPEVWYCRDCETFRPLDGEEAFECDAPLAELHARLNGTGEVSDS